MNQFNIKFKSFASSSAGNSYIIEGFKTKILIEAGISVNKIAKAINHDFSGIDACLVSHSHGDHNKSTYEVASRGVDVYAHKSVFKKFKSHHRFHEIKKKTFKIGEFTITCFDVDHDVPNYGFMIDSELSGERLIFIIDTYYSEYTFDNVDYWIVECNHSEDLLRKAIEKSENNFHLKRLWNSHFSLERLRSLLDANDLTKAKQIHLTHLSSGNGDGSHFKEVIENRYGIDTFVCEA